jgi:hypothetical protein
MRKIAASVALASALGLATMTLGAFASTPTVVATVSVADHGQGGWGGGSLFSDGTASGGTGFSVANGAIVAVGTLASWTGTPTLGGFVTVCFDIRQLKPAATTFMFCPTLPVTGTPIVVTDPEGGQTTIRVTPTR